MSATEDAPSELREGRIASTKRRATITLIDQGFSSLSNFAVGVAVARVAGASGLGAFSLAYAVWLVVAAMHRSLVTDPMAIEGDSRGEGRNSGVQRGLAAELLLGAAGGVFLAALGLVFLAAGESTFGWAMLALVPWLPTLVIQDYWRWVGFMTSRPGRALANDAVFNAMQLAALLGVFASQTASAAAVIAAWGSGGLAGALFGLHQERRAIGRSDRSIRLPHIATTRAWLGGGFDLLRARWGISRWIAGTSLVGWGTTQASSFVVGLILGPAGLGGLSAAQTLATGPSLVLIQAGGSVGLPEASKACANEGMAGLRRVTRVVTGLGIVSVSLCTALVAIFGRHVLVLVYGRRFGYVEPAAVITGVAYVVSALALGPILVLKTTRNTVHLFRVQAIALAVSLVGVSVLSALYGIDGAAASALPVAAVSVIGFHWYERRVRRSAALSSEPDGPADDGPAEDVTVPSRSL